MKKLLVVIISILFALTVLSACNADDVQDTLPARKTPEPPPIQNGQSSDDTQQPSALEPAPVDAEPSVVPKLPDDLCPYCGEHYVHEPLRQPTPPLNIHEIDFPREEREAGIAEILRNFENVHKVTYTQFETNWYSTIVLWTDIPLRDFSFVSLDVAGHYWREDRELIIDTREVLLTVDVLLPGDAVVLNVAFSHYLLPHGAIIFTDEHGVQQRMFIIESMRGGCFPIYHLTEAHELATY